MGISTVRNMVSYLNIELFPGKNKHTLGCLMVSLNGRMKILSEITGRGVTPKSASMRVSEQRISRSPVGSRQPIKGGCDWLGTALYSGALCLMPLFLLLVT